MVPQRKDEEKHRGDLGQCGVMEILGGAFESGQPAECYKRFRGQKAWRPRKAIGFHYKVVTDDFERTK